MWIRCEADEPHNLQHASDVRRVQVERCTHEHTDEHRAGPRGEKNETHTQNRDNYGRIPNKRDELGEVGDTLACVSDACAHKSDGRACAQSAPRACAQSPSAEESSSPSRAAAHRDQPVEACATAALLAQPQKLVSVRRRLAQRWGRCGGRGAGRRSKGEDLGGPGSSSIASRKVCVLSASEA